MEKIPDMKNKMYQFSKDWFSINISSLEKLLVPLCHMPLQILEIGCYEGRSTTWFLENVLLHPMSSITCVDPLEEPSLRETFFDNVIHTFGDKIELFIGKSGDVLKYDSMISRKFDVIYIDGDHKASNVMEDAVLSFPLLKEGGIMIFDDFASGANDIKNTELPYLGICGFVEAYKPYIDVLHQEYQLTIRKNVYTGGKTGSTEPTDVCLASPSNVPMSAV